MLETLPWMEWPGGSLGIGLCDWLHVPLHAHFSSPPSADPLSALVASLPPQPLPLLQALLFFETTDAVGGDGRGFLVARLASGGEGSSRPAAVKGAPADAALTTGSGTGRQAGRDRGRSTLPAPGVGSVAPGGRGQSATPAAGARLSPPPTEPSDSTQSSDPEGVWVPGGEISASAGAAAAPSDVYEARAAAPASAPTAAEGGSHQGPLLSPGGQAPPSPHRWSAPLFFTVEPPQPGLSGA